MSSELPEGITFNKAYVHRLEIDLTDEIINNIKCDACDLELESVLSTLSNRNSGKIKTLPKGNIIWENSLPKDRTKAIKMLNETLASKLQKHKERH
jgi:hypothetical protein